MQEFTDQQKKQWKRLLKRMERAGVIAKRQESKGIRPADEGARKEQQ